MPIFIFDNCNWLSAVNVSPLAICVLCRTWRALTIKWRTRMNMIRSNSSSDNTSLGKATLDSAPSLFTAFGQFHLYSLFTFAHNVRTKHTHKHSNICTQNTYDIFNNSFIQLLQLHNSKRCECSSSSSIIMVAHRVFSLRAFEISKTNMFGEFVGNSYNNVLFPLSNMRCIYTAVSQAVS